MAYTLRNRETFISLFLFCNFSFYIRYTHIRQTDMAELILLLFIFQLVVSCVINTYFNVVPPKSILGIIILSMLPFSIQKAIEVSEVVESDLLDDFLV